MKTLLLLFSSLTLLFTGCVIDLDWQTGNGVAVTETRSLPAFTRVELESPIQVTIKAGSHYAAYVTGDANLVSYFETDAFGGVLTISQAYALDPVVDPHITLIVPDLRSVTHQGMGLVDIVEDGNFPDLTLTLNGSGEIRFSGTASRLRAELNGSGNIHAEGFADHLVATLRGQGEINAENLLAGDADVELSGAGNIYLDLDYDSELNLDLSGSGKVEWWGAPARLNYDLRGSGRVVEHRGLPKKSANAPKALLKGAGGLRAYETTKPKVSKKPSP